MQRLFLCTASVLLASALAACGDDGGPTIDNYPGKLEDAICNHQVQCGDAKSVAECKANLDIDAAAAQADVKAGVVKFDGAAASECLALQGGSCDILEGLYDKGNPCNEVIKGTVADGGACNYDIECLSDSCTATDAACDPEKMCCPGTCDPTEAPAPTNVAIGGTCKDSSDECVVGAYCKFPQTGDGTCTKFEAAGAACDSLDACGEGNICDIFADAPTCKTPADSGAACDPMDFIPCADARDNCDSTMKCSRAPDVGQACDNSVGNFCIGYATCVNAVCVKDPGLGEACTTNDGDPECQGNTSCTSGTCQLGDPSLVCTL